jgi:hypothetical protein
LPVLRGDGRYGGGLVVASRGYMGPTEVQALIGQWVDLVGKDHSHHRHHDRDRDRGEYGQTSYEQPAQWYLQQPIWWQRQHPWYPQMPWQPQQAQLPWQSQQPGRPSYGPPYPPYQRPLPASAYRQPIVRPYGTVIRDHRTPQPFVGAEVPGYDLQAPLDAFPWPPRAAVVDAPLPTEANRDILPMSTGVPILPTQSAQITGRPQTLVYKIGRFVISNAGTAGGAADWIVNDIKIGNRSQFVQSGDVPGDMFATNAIDTFVRFASAQTAMDVVVVVTYIGLNESGCPFFGAMVGTAAV